MREFKCEICNKRFSSEDGLSQHKDSKHPVKAEKKSFRNYIIIGLFILIALALLLFVYSYMTSPGRYDNFAKCLTEKGTIVYGNDFCQYTKKQFGFFGRSSKYLNYVKCSENKGLCDENGIKITPTWEINGEMYEQVQSFERLSALSGCNL